MLDSAQLAPLIPSHARTIVDIGSGAGFPGMVLAILLSPPPPCGEGSGGGVRHSDTATDSQTVVAAADPHPNPSPQGGGGILIHLIESTQKKARFLG